MRGSVSRRLAVARRARVMVLTILIVEPVGENRAIEARIIELSEG
jgi:hypothetical protein